MHSCTKQLFFALALILVCGTAASAAQNDKEYVYTDATSLPLYGKITSGTAEPFSRLPESMRQTVRPAVWKLGRNSAGLYIRFTSDAGDFRFKWSTLMLSSYTNMTGVTMRGLALYVLDGGGKWMYLSSHRPGTGADNESKCAFSELKGKTCEYMLYLSLYDGVSALQIGVPEGSTLEASTLDTPRSEKPVIIYGTSILQGASASHPGSCGTAILSRMLDRTVINLGFSGNCLLEEPMAEYMASYPDPGMYVFDNWNGKYEIGKEGLEKCIRIVLEAHPDTPVLVASRAFGPSVRFDEAQKEDWTNKRVLCEEVVAKLRKEGFKHIYVVHPEVLDAENNATSDGDHFNDEAFAKWAKAVAPIIRKELKRQ